MVLCAAMLTIYPGEIMQLRVQHRHFSLIPGNRGWVLFLVICSDKEIIVVLN